MNYPRLFLPFCETRLNLEYLGHWEYQNASTIPQSLFQILVFLSQPPHLLPRHLSITLFAFS